MNNKFIQSGLNEKYPIEIITWTIDERPIPEWITDRCKITGVLENGDPVLFTNNNNLGGLDFISAGNNSVFLSTKGRNDYICYDPKTKYIFSLHPMQLKLLYKLKL